MRGLALPHLPGIRPRLRVRVVAEDGRGWRRVRREGVGRVGPAWYRVGVLIDRFFYEKALAGAFNKEKLSPVMYTVFPRVAPRT